MGRVCSHAGGALCVGGAAALAYALWAPWYGLDDVFLFGSSRTPGADALAAAADSGVTGWSARPETAAVLAAVAVGGALLGLGALTSHGARHGLAGLFLSALGLTLVVKQLVDPPERVGALALPSELSLSTRGGLVLAAAAHALLIAGFALQVWSQRLCRPERTLSAPPVNGRNS